VVFEERFADDGDAERFDASEEGGGISDAAEDKGLFAGQLGGRDGLAVKGAGLILSVDGMENQDVGLKTAERAFNLGDLFFRGQVKSCNHGDVSPAD